MGYIYKVTNTINGKVYIGQTMRTVPIRWKEHIRDSYKPNRGYMAIIHCAIRKYGQESFTVSQIEQCDNSIINEREKYWIKQYNSCSTGYNISNGGGGWLKTTDEELLNLWNNGMLLKDIAKETNTSEYNVSRRLDILGIPKEERIKRGNKHRKQVGTEKVYKYDVDGNFISEYDSLRLAQESIGGERIKFGKSMKGFTTHGFQWRKFKTDKIESVRNKKHRTKAVHQYSTNGDYIRSFDSARQAGINLGKEHFGVSIINVCKGKSSQAYGYKWSFERKEAII